MLATSIMQILGFLTHCTQILVEVVNIYCNNKNCVENGLNNTY